MNPYYYESAERNKTPILEVIRPYMRSGTVLEIGTGTGQHGIFFTEQIPELVWQCSDIPSQHEIIQKNIEGVDRVLSPLPIDLTEPNCFDAFSGFDAVYTTNTLHIVSEDSVKNLLNGIHKVLSRGGNVFIYGPFKYNGKPTTQSNADFEVWLKNRNPESGLRDFEMIRDGFKETGIELVADHAMPANNQLLVFKRVK